jgi:hypothetical protein
MVEPKESIKSNQHGPPSYPVLEGHGADLDH